MTPQDHSEEATFQTLGGFLRRRYKVLIPFILLPIAALLFSLHEQKQYTTAATVLFNDVPSMQTPDGVPTTLASDNPDREAATSIGLLSLDSVRQQVARRTGRTGVAKTIDVKVEGQSNLLDISATDPSPERAAATANAYAGAYVAYRRKAVQKAVNDQIQFIQSELSRLTQQAQRGGRGRPLKAQLRKLNFFDARADGGASVVSKAEVPALPTSPKPARNTILAVIVALFLGGGAMLLFERLDPRLRSPKELETTLGRPIVGLIHKSRVLARRRVRSAPPLPEADAFVGLQSYLRYSGADRGDLRSVMITSSAPGDGKTTVAWNLACTAANANRRVLLIEADLREPTLARGLGVKPDRGLADVLDHRISLEEAIQRIAVETPNNGHLPARIVDIIFAKPPRVTMPDPRDWEELGDAIKRARETFDLVVIDSPPVTVVPDVLPLIANVDGVLVVGRLGNTPRASLARLRDQLSVLDAPTVGAVVNSVGRDSGYAYGYGYRTHSLNGHSS